jgi:IS605 OrfB family transposase
MPQNTSESQIFTYQTRLKLDDKLCQLLAGYAMIMGKIERTLFADLARGKDSSQLKSDYLKRFEITARQFNALRVQVEGKISSVKELRKMYIQELDHRIDSLEKKLPKIKNANARHQKKRRLAHLKVKYRHLQDDENAGKVHMCFGGRKLFRAQFSLKENGYGSHEEWKDKWQKFRSDEIFLLGSKDEASGNQSCTARIQEDGSLTLRLRLPNCMASEFGKYVEIPNVSFTYGHEAILASLYSSLDHKGGNKEAGAAITYRFLKDEKGWKLFASTPKMRPKIISDAQLGAVGVDINADHLAVVEVDRYGNAIRHENIPLTLYGKDTHQTKALIGDAVKQVINLCAETKKPLVLEHLSFQDKKATLREEASASQSRMLSSFAYNAVIQAMKSRGFRFGVEVHQVNPAYTSVIGRCKFAEIYGLTVHEAAAMVIARRFQGVSERLPRNLDKVPDGKGGHVTLSLPARNRDKHVWTSWRQVRRDLRVALAGQFRATKRRSSDPPVYCESNISDFAGENPARESSAALFG